MRNHDELLNPHGFAGHDAPARQAMTPRRTAAMPGTMASGTALQGSLMSLDEARERLMDDDCGKWDSLTPRSELRLKDGKVAFPLDQREEQWQHLSLSSWATGQLCARLGIPAGYFRKCPSILQDVQANYWLRERGNNVSVMEDEAGMQEDEKFSDGELSDEAKNGSAACACRVENRSRSGSGTEHERWLLRAKGGTLRAVLSERYSPLDNATLMDTLLPLLGSRYQVDWFGLSSESLHLRLIDPQKTREVLPDDALSVGVHLANSEVGLRAVTVDALVYRLVCKNGLVRLVKGKSFLHRRHVYLDETRFAVALREAVAGALGEAESFLEQLAQTTRQTVEDGAGTLEQLAQKKGLPDHLRQAMTQALQREGKQSETLYGVVNAVTEAAQRLPDEARYDLEVLAGHLAEHGVAAYAPRRSPSKTVRIALTEEAIPETIELPPALTEALGVRKESENDESYEEDESTEDEGLTPSEERAMRIEIVGIAERMFGAQIVSRVPHDAQEREVEAAEVTA